MIWMMGGILFTEKYGWLIWGIVISCFVGEARSQTPTPEGSVDGSESSEGGARKKKKKSVQWAPEAHLRQFFYFELDETERGEWLERKFYGLLSKYC